MNSLESIWLAYLSQPSSDRVLYRAIRKRKLRRIMEIGIGDLRRGVRMIRLAQRYHPAAEVRYIGVDLFEARPKSGMAEMSLKQAYRTAPSDGARIHLIPSDAIQSLVRSANALPGNELVIVAADQTAEHLPKHGTISRGCCTHGVALLGQCCRRQIRMAEDVGRRIAVAGRSATSAAPLERRLLASPTSIAAATKLAGFLQ